MTNPDRRAIALMAIMSPLFPAAATSFNAEAADAPGSPAPDHDMSAMPASWNRRDEIAMLIYPRMTALDVIGPQHFFASMMGARVHLVAKTRDPVTSDTGVIITPTATFEDCPRNLTVLFTGGGTDGTLAAMRDEATRAFMADRGSRATYVTSVCTGSLILGAAGLLKGYRATSHWAALDVLPDFGAIPVAERVVHDRNRITGAGVTAGLDFGLSMVAELRDATYAQGVQLQAEYDPHPPFSSGSLATATPAVRGLIEPMTAGFTRRAHELAQSLRT